MNIPAHVKQNHCVLDFFLGSFRSVNPSWVRLNTVAERVAWSQLDV